MYNTNNKITNVFKLISEPQESLSETTKKNIYNKALISFPRQEEYLFESSGVYGDNLFILVNPIRWSPKKYIVDIYSISQGDYKYSLLFNENSNLKEVFLTDDKIYLIKENTEVVIFDYSIEN
ncbi:MAG TPA: hypothetical protein PKD03_14885 [Ignavibacteriaceae bacterium]|nr:hypothetical protein [Ignavibacteriaceae bacterium]